MRQIKSRFYSNFPTIICALFWGLILLLFLNIGDSIMPSHYICPPKTFKNVKRGSCTLDLGKVKIYNTGCKCPNEKKCFDVIMESGKIHYLLKYQIDDFDEELSACQKSIEVKITDNK